MVLPSLHEQLAAAGLGRLEAEVSSLSETSIGFWLTGPPEEPPISPMSKLGGNPDLPGRFEWPVGERPLDFLLQLNLNELRNMEMARLLPRSGVLSFFYDLEAQPWGFELADRNRFKVVYFPETSTFIERRHPEGEARLDQRCLDFFPRISVPHLRSQAGDLLEIRASMTEWEMDRYAEFAAAYERRQGPPMSEANHHFLGYSENIQNDMQVQAQLVSNGAGEGGEGSRELRGQLKEGASEWVLLLQLDSDPSANLNWGDAGMLYFWIPRQDLRDRRFDRVWAILQSY
ncbi:MAG TPA: YwqG family protein [Actinomycetota bacterium]|nr:YwqG family protein [Actinomycetota bacterium]